jgi:transcriptional regulator with XRE-family HTH domain
MELNEILAIYRKKAKLKQSEMGEKLGMTGGGYSAIEQGRTPITVDRVFDLIDILGEQFAMVFMLYFQNRLVKTYISEDMNTTSEIEKEMKKGSFDVEKLMLLAKKGEMEIMKHAINNG